jgi:aminopeptidase N
VSLETSGKGEHTVPFVHDGQKLILDLRPAWPAGRDATVRVDYRLRDPKQGLYFFGPTPAEPQTPAMLWSQGETSEARYWFPCLDQPDQRQSTELVVTVADGFDVVSNGKLVERRPAADRKTVTYHWRQEQPHPSYLVTLVVGRFDIVREQWRGKPVLFYVPRGRGETVARSFGHTRDMLTFFSDRFGIEYPWDQYAQVVVEQFSAGGMENTSATTLTEMALLDARAALDQSTDGLVAHEMGHQWWGDLVTCRSWAHVWLNEGFATFAALLWTEHSKGPDEAAYQLLQEGRAAMAGDKDRPIVDRRYPFELAMFDARAYPKGSWVLHMLRRQLGEDAFWRGLRRYGTEYRLRAAETSDFRKVLERVSGRSLERFFYDWTERAGHPVVQVSTEYVPESKEARVTVKQTQKGEAFRFPLKLVFSFRNGKGSPAPVVREEDVLDKEHTFVVTLPARPSLVEVDPDQAVLAELHETKGRELWLEQLRAGSSVTSRLRAAQHFGQSKATADREALARALSSDPFWGVRAEVAAALGESGGDPCRDALINGLGQPNPKVRRACAAQLGDFHRDGTAASALKALLRRGDPSYFVEEAALAAYAKLQPADVVGVLTPWLAKPSYNEVLRTAVLNGLGTAEDVAALDTLLDWTKRGKSRECRAAALAALATLSKTGRLTDDQQKRVVAIVTACLEGEQSLVRGAAVGALRDMGRTATPALAALEALRRHDPSDHLRDMAKAAIDQIHTNTPVPAELTRLREELDRLKRSNDTLQKRLDRFEKVERKGA